MVWGILTACAPTLSFGSADRAVARATLANGLRVVAVKSPFTGVVSTTVSYLVGANEVPEAFPGLAHGQEHMMFRGSPGLSAGQISRIAAFLGGSFNAVTKQTVTQFFFTVPAEDLDVVLHLEAIRMRSALDTEELWMKERAAIQQEVARYLSDPEYLAAKKVFASLFAGSVYAHDSLGTSESFEKIDGAMLRAFHRKWYAPNNAVVVIVGDVDPAQTIAEVRKYFGHIPARSIPPKPKVDLKPVQPAAFELDTDRPHGVVSMSFRLPGSGSPDFAATRVLAEILASESGGLHDLVGRGRALSTEFSLDPLPAASVGSARAAFPGGEKGDAAKVTQDLRSIVSGLRRKGIETDAVEAAKRRLTLKAEISKSSVGGMADAWSQAVAIEGRASPDQDLDDIGRVTASDVARVAREHLDPDIAVVAVLTPRPSRESPRSPPVAPGMALTPEEKPQSVSLPGWAAKVLHPARIPPSTIHPVVHALPNGLELIVEQRAFSRAVFVSGQVQVEPGLAVPQGKEGVQETLQQLFSFGTTSVDRRGFGRALESIGAEESAGERFSLRVLDEHFDRGMKLLADNLLHPALPEEAFRTVQAQLAASVAGRLESPSYRADRALRLALLPSGDPNLRETVPKTVAQLTLDDVRDYYRRVFRPDATKIVIVGNVSPEHALEVVTELFGGWKTDDLPSETLLPPVPPNAPSSATVVDANSVQANVTLAQTLDVTRADADYYALELGNHVLIGAFNATRLYRELREETGLAYGVSSNVLVGKTRSFYVVRFACAPVNVSRARSIVVRNLVEMQTSLVSSAELDQARALLLHEIPLSEASAESIAKRLLRRAIDGLPLDEPTRAARRYARIDAAEVRRAFEKQIRPRGLAEVIAGPP